MTEEARERVRRIYDNVTGRAQAIIEVFEHQFTEPLVDNSLYTFDELIDWLSEKTLGNLGIRRWVDSNEYGSYTLNREDYKAHGRGKTFFEYLPDLGIIDYLTPVIRDHILEVVQMHSPNINKKAFLITIRFPEVTVTNEYDRSTVIYDLFVRVPVTLEGRTYEGFNMARTTYPSDQWLSGYAHSHLPGINTEGFYKPCTGSGPINNTISTLSGRYDINVWGLYSFEIAKYVTVESIAGTPYRRLENIGSNQDKLIKLSAPKWKGLLRGYYGCYYADMLQPFVLDFLKNGHIKFTYRNGGYTLGEDLLGLWIRVSNEFIKWHNKNIREQRVAIRKDRLFSSGLIKEYYIANGMVYDAAIGNRIQGIERLEGKEMFMFKGEMQRLHFLDRTAATASNTTILVDINLLYYILTKAIEVISYRYGREKETREGGNGPRCLYL